MVYKNNLLTFKSFFFYHFSIFLFFFSVFFLSHFLSNFGESNIAQQCQTNAVADMRVHCLKFNSNCKKINPLLPV